jgi:hypothetical protein
MARRWILDTETKGTGAQMVPLDEAERKQAAGGQSVIVAPEHREPPPKPARPRGPRRFKVVDVMTRQTLAEDVDARAAVDLLKGVRSFVDVSVYVWEQQAGRWQQLTQREQRMLWDRAAAERA